MQELDPISLERKYTADPPELQCNEVMLLPYYIANLNIEQQFYTATNRYAPYEGICLVDTFEVAEERHMHLFTPANTERVEKQKETPMFVVIGNPPYNAGQVNENDNNKNRKYETMDKRIADTYAKDSKATLRNKLYDPYVKAVRWALDRIGEEGVVAFGTNNSFLDGVAFDGMCKHLAEDCDAIYILDLGGNARRGLKVSNANVFGIRVGVSINLLIKKSSVGVGSPNLYCYQTMNDVLSLFPFIFPTPETELENRVIWLKVGREWPMFGLMVNQFPDQLPQGGSQCFPFYTYDEDGTNRRENITDWALTHFQTHYQDNTITKWDIFHYNYGLLYHSDYREKYEANLKRDLPHIPFAENFWGFAEVGALLADFHVNYESQPEYDKLKFIQNPDVPLDWRVEKMKLSRDKTQIIYNNFLTIDGVPQKYLTIASATVPR